MGLNKAEEPSDKFIYWIAILCASLIVYVIAGLVGWLVRIAFHEGCGGYRFVYVQKWISLDRCREPHQVASYKILVNTCILPKGYKAIITCATYQNKLSLCLTTFPRNSLANLAALVLRL